MPPSFERIHPRAAAIPVVVEVPHAGLAADAEALATLVAPARSLARDADLYVDELFADAPALGATLLVARVSRYVCDLNRSPTEVDARAVEGAQGTGHAHGLVWHRTTDGQPALERPLPRAELERRIDGIYRPYHEALLGALHEVRRQFGFVILLCGHSMPSRGRRDHSDLGQERADVVPGSRGRTSAAAAVIDAVEHVARARGLGVRHDEPYRGGYSTGHYGRPEENIHAIQVELNRKLYMSERSLQRKPNDFEETRALCGTLVAELGKLALA